MNFVMFSKADLSLNTTNVLLSASVPPVHRGAVVSAAVSGGLPGRDPLPQREAVPCSSRHAVPGGGLVVLRLGARRAGGASGHLI